MLGPQHEAGNADPVRALHRLDQQRVRLRRAAIGHQVVGALVIDGIDLRQIDEVLDLDRLVGAGVERFQLLARHRDVSSLAELEALDDVLPGNFLTFDAAHALLLDTPAVLVVQHVEAHFLVAHRRHGLHGDVHEPEVDRAGPDRSQDLTSRTTSRASLSSLKPLNTGAVIARPASTR